jgi:SAM-dependent methyltransferase
MLSVSLTTGGDTEDDSRCSIHCSFIGAIFFSFGLLEGRIRTLTDYDATYYRSNAQDADRTALSWYRRLVFRYAAVGPVMDYGCGTGWLISHLARRRISDGYEPSDYAATAAKRLNPGSRIYSRASDIPRGKYAAISAIHVLEHVAEDDLDSELATISSWLRPTGILVIVTPDAEGLGATLNGSNWRGFDDPTHINLQGHRWWCNKLKKSGFDVIAEGTDGLWDPPYGSRIADRARMIPIAAQVLTGRLFIAPGHGESSVVVARKRTGAREF